jgi:hypothetical protein
VVVDADLDRGPAASPAGRAWRQRINRVSGALLGAIALWALAQAAASGLAHG